MTSSNGIFLHFPCLVTTFNYAVHAKVVPQNGAQEREESAEGMSPLVTPGHETQQKIRQQGCPYLPSDGVLAVSEEVRELKRLLDLLEDHLHAPAAPVELADSVGRPVEAVRDEGHLRLVPPDIDLRPHQPDLLRIKLAGAFPRQTDALVGQDRAVFSGVLALACRLLSHISGSLPRLGGGALPACRLLSRISGCRPASPAAFPAWAAAAPFPPAGCCPASPAAFPPAGCRPADSKRMFSLRRVTQTTPRPESA